jgi:uncharacterized protein (TIGR03083 family)
MTVTVVDVADIAPLAHDEAMDLAEAEYARLLGAVDALGDTDWSRPTDCEGWDVKAMLGHVLGMLELQTDAVERTRQISTAAQDAARNGGLRLDAMTALQVREHEHLSPGELREALHAAAPPALAARRALPAEVRAAPFDPQLPGVSGWTVGYLFDVIHTRDPWLHRVDLARATGHALVLTAEQDGRIVADVVAEWARLHGGPFELRLAGPAGGSYVAGTSIIDERDVIDCDAVEFCRILSGRAPGTGLLTTRVVF